MHAEYLIGYIMPSLILIIFSIAGIISYLFPPKKINGIYGYRTPRSMKNQENWDYAQKLGAKYMMLFGGIIFIAQTLLGYLVTSLKYELNYIIPFQLIAMIILLIVMLILCERKLKEFENKGNSR
jgi:uncharacterized membrane protein